MVGDAEPNRLTSLWLERQALADAFGGLQTARDVFCLKRAFADVVKEEGKEEQFGLVDFLQDTGEAPIPSFARVEWRRGVGLHGLVAQGVEVLNGHDGVFVHGVPVIEVTDYQRVDSAELRKERHQQA